MFVNRRRSTGREKKNFRNCSQICRERIDYERKFRILTSTSRSRSFRLFLTTRANSETFNADGNVSRFYFLLPLIFRREQKRTPRQRFIISMKGTLVEKRSRQLFRETFPLGYYSGTSWRKYDHIVTLISHSRISSTSETYRANRGAYFSK